MAQSDRGRIEIFEDFVGVEDPIALTAVPRALGPFMVVGQGIADTDAGAPALDSDGLSGAVQLTTTNEADHTTGLQTSSMFDVGLMGTIVVEARVRQAALSSREIFMGLTDINIGSDVPSIQANLSHIDTVTVTLTASDLVGFHLSSEATDATDWHGIYNGGTTTGETTSTSVDLNDVAVAGEWQVLRLEIANNGTARWYTDGTLRQTVKGAVSTSTDLKFFIAAEAKATTIATLDVDYIYISANRDWTV